MSEQAPIELRSGCVRNCPGCAHRQMSAAHSESQKQQWLRHTLSDWASSIQPIRAVYGAARWNYRDRVCLKAEWRDAQWHIGMNVGETVIDIPRCPVHSERVQATLKTLQTRLPDARWFPLTYFVQCGAQVTLVLKCKHMPDCHWLDASCMAELREAGVAGLWLHLHPAVGKKIFNKPGWQLIWGRSRSLDAQGFQYGPVGFQQLLPTLYAKALLEAANFLQPCSGSVAVDLYSGGGTTLRRWTQAGAATIGVELGAQACECARINAAAADVLRGKCALRIPQLKQWIERQDVQGKSRLLYVNPPRPGLEPEIRTWITQVYRPDRIAYLSCSAGTLRRDLETLARNDYRVVQIIPYDFFPHTYHVETLSLLRRRCK